MGQTKHVPARRCVGCREMKDKKDLVRVLRTTEGTVEIDRTGKKNGRGAYLCANASCLEAAIRSKGLERALKTAVTREILEELKKEIGAVEK